MTSSVTQKINRLNITGPIVADTPKCVIFEIAESLSYGISREEDRDSYCEMVVKKINEKPTEILTVNTMAELAKEDISKIIVYVGCANVDNWTVSSLKIAFKHLQKYQIDVIPPLPPDDFKYGPKSSAFPLNYDACMLYRLCRYNNIKTNRNMTIEQMAYLVRMLNQDTTDIRNNILTMVKMMPKHQLLTLSLAEELKNPPTVSKTLPPSIREKNIQALPDLKKGRLDYNKIIASHKNVTNLNHLIARVDPTTHEEAIVLGALVYGINLTDSTNPHNEYMELCYHNDDSKYMPVDNLFKMRYILNSLWYDAQRTWSPFLDSVYTTEQIMAFARSEGYKDVDEKFPDSNAAREFLCMARLTHTFYIGVHPSLIKTESDLENLQTIVEMDNVFDIGPGKILSFGVADTGKFELYTADSLVDHFRINKKFTMPGNPLETLPVSAIIKLKNICREFTGTREESKSPVSRGPLLGTVERLAAIPLTPGFSTMANSIVTFANIFNRAYTSTRGRKKDPKNVNINELVTDYTNLLQSIEAVERLNIANSAHAIALKALHEDTTYKDHIENFLKALLHMGYYMRGWKVQRVRYNMDKDTLPIDKDETQTMPDNQGEIDINVTEAIKNLERLLLRCPLKISTALRQLPLMISYHDAINDSVTYAPSTTSEDGFTILDRIAICKNGSSTYSCIRTSSNHFLTSAYYYMAGCGMELPFDIRRMSKIS